MLVGGAARVAVLAEAMRPLTLLVAPAGAGKTALLSYWASRDSDTPLWFDARQPGDRTDLRALLVAGRVDPVVVIDEGHDLTRVECALLVDAVVRGDVRALVAARRDLPLPVVHLELSGLLRLLRGDHLRLTASETRELVTAHAPAAAASDVEAVARRANGWAAAVILGAHTLASAADRGTARAALVATDQPILDYLLDEVFATLPAAVRHVLLCTADEDRVSAASAEVLSGDPAAPACLAQLSVEGMFVASYDGPGPDGEPGPVYVYHPLLSELLHRQTAQGRPDAPLAAAAHARAAEQYAGADRPELALRHAVESHEPRLVVELLVTLSPRLLATGRGAAVAHAVAALTGDMRLRSREALVVAAMERRAAGDVEAVLRLVGELPRAVITPARARPGGASGLALEAMVEADEAGLRLWLTRTGFGDARSAVEDVSRRLGPPVVDEAEAPALEPARLARLAVDLAYGLLAQGDVDAASVRAQQAAAMARAARSDRLSGTAEEVIALTELVAARFGTAAAVASRALRRLGAHAGNAVHEAGLRAVLGWAAWHAYDTPEARRQLELARAALIPGADPLAAAVVRQLAARVLADEGDVAVARRILAGDVELPGAPPFLEAMLELLRGELALAAGDDAAAATHIEALAHHGWNAERRLLAADLAMRRGRADDARALLAPVLHPAASAAPRAEACAAAAVAVELAFDLVTPDNLDPETLRHRLRDLLSRTAPQRLIRVFAPLLASPRFLPVLRHEAHAADAHPFARDVLEALSRVALTPSPASLPSPPPAVRPAELPRQPRQSPRERRHGTSPAEPRHAPPPVPALTPREQDVLDRLAQGEEYVDIAQHLYITQNTVKTHVTSLYRKLNVGRRSQALRAARDLGLLAEVGAVSPAPGEPPGGVTRGSDATRL